ncbi:MAG: hypothetical protein LC637_09535 [Xanthomonadaceae bacterium]|nr:hypothetical protein [Xanthomonadaceae bacterium]
MPKSPNKQKGKNSRKPAARRRTRSSQVAPPSFSSLEGRLDSMGPVESSRSRPEDLAQELVYSAWETNVSKTRVDRARRALKLWPDCADAWVILANALAETLEQKREFYAAGVAAGQRALGEEAFTEDVGHFWGILETRPYMRARAGLARVLQQLARLDEAVGHLRELLRLDPLDHQGNRYFLVHWFLQADRDDDAMQVINEYSDDSIAEWAYSRALLAFRRQGPTSAASELLDTARMKNSFVPAYLLGRRQIPKDLPDTLGFGDDREAVAYAADYKAIWKKTPGALDWLKSNLGKKIS